MSKKANKTPQADKTRDETLLALLQEKTKTDAAKRLSIDRSTLYQRIERYGLDQVIAEMPKKALQQLQLGSIRAAEVMVEQLEDRKNKMEAAKEILDRTGVVRKDSGKGFIQQINVGDMGVEFIEEK
jgi:hypothetical protein